MKSTYIDNYFYQNPNTFKVIRKPIAHPIESRVLDAQPDKTTSVDFQQVCEKNGSIFLIDKKAGIGRIAWNGNVDIHVAKKLISTAFKAITSSNCSRLILDHSQLIAFETEARVWVKEVIKYKAESVSEMLEQLASISPKSSTGSMFSNFAGETLKGELPQLSMKRFDNAEEAINWLN